MASKFVSHLQRCLTLLLACGALSAMERERDRPDLREAWRAKYYGVPATADYLDYKGRLAAKELERHAPGFRGAFAGVPAWREIGPNAGRTGFPLVSTEINDSGRSTAIVTHPTDPKIMYVAYSGGGVWKTTNGDLASTSDWSWHSITDALPASSSGGNIAVGAFAMHPSLPDTLYLALGDAFDEAGRGFYLSTDAGNSWTKGGPLGSATRSYALLPVTGAILVGTDAGLFRSTDGGTTFSAVSLTGLSNPKVWSIVALSPTDLVLAAAASSAGSLWYSSDAGKTWTKGTPDSSVKSPNRISLATSAASGSIVYGTFQTGSSVAKGLLKSSDKGKTWTFVNGQTAGVLSDGSGQGFYNLGIAVDPDDPNRVFIGANNSVWRTLDGGTSWSRMTDAYHSRYQYAHADVHCTAWTRTGPKALIYGTDGGFTIFRDPYRTPIPVAASGSAPVPDRTFADSRRNTGISTQLVYNLGCTIATMPADARYRIVTGHQDNGSRVRVGTGAALNNSTSFDETAPTGDGFAALIHPLNGDLMLTASYQNGVMKSTTGGGEGSWTDSVSGLGGGGPFKSVLVHGLADATGNTVYTFSNAVYKSTDFGSTWSALSMSGYSGSISHVNAARSDAKAIAVVDGGTGGVTYNGGTNWTTFGAFPNASAASYVTFDSTNAQVIYVASALNSATAAHLFRSQNGGQSWQAVDTASNGFPFGIPVHVVQVAPWSSQEVFVGTDFGVYRSGDAGATWERYGQGLPLVSVRDLYLAPDRSFIRVATFGRGVWEINPTASTTVSVAVTPGAITLKPAATQTFTAAVVNTPNTAVTWSVQEGAAGGTITAGGVYTAPATTGTYHVVATSVADPAQKAVATVTVARNLDLNKDGRVDLRDLLVLGHRFGTADADTDLDGSGTVDSSDLNLLLAGL